MTDRKKTKEQIEAEIQDWTKIQQQHLANKNNEAACQAAYFISALRWCLNEKINQ